MEIYIMLSDTGSLLTKAIKRYTKDPYNHVSLALNKELTEVYSFGRKREYNPFIGGFVNEDIHSHLLNKSKCEVYQIEVTQEQYSEIINQLDSFSENKNLYGYNFLGLLAIILDIDYIRDDHYFCSQFVCSVLDHASVKITEKPYHYTTPNDFRLYTDKKLIFKGSMIDYPFKGLTQPRETMSYKLYNKMNKFLYI